MDQEAFFTSPLLDYVTLADMARQLRCSIQQVERLAEKNGLRPTRRNGVVRLWNRKDMERLRAGLEKQRETNP